MLRWSSRIGRLALLLAAWCGLCRGIARAQMGPGPLSQAHADLEGVTKCASCHDFGARALKCLGCHAEIRSRIESGKGYHARAYRRTPTETDCARCHAEHRGPKFALIPLDRRSFDHHAQTGFNLEGRHRVQKCEGCHNAPKIGAAARSEIKMKDPNRSFLGLRRECTACHREPHRSQLGADCLSCHTQDAWRPASRFDHSRAAFPLNGLHLKLSCEKCHVPAATMRPPQTVAGESSPTSSPAEKALLFKGLSFGSCQSCHTDRHRGAFQAVKLSGKCETCHVIDGWKSNRPGSSFDHKLAEFRLDGKHAGLSCGKCHKDADFGRPVAHALCRDCHQDTHKGQFAGREAGSDCAACHTTAAFKPSLFDRDAHMRSPFALTGKHSTLRCAECHQPEGREARYKTGKFSCAACHAEPHGGEFASEPYNSRCDMCHTVAGFDVTTFSRERHAQTQFPLTGRHADVACHKCHKPLPSAASGADGEVRTASAARPAPAGAERTAAKNARRQYRFSSRACIVCHADPHVLSPQAGLSCEACHSVEAWKPMRPFDHTRTRFNLEGSHQNPDRPIACIKCHRATPHADGAMTPAAPLFSRRTGECSSCHNEKDAHGGQFSSPVSRGRDCASCHDTMAWKAPRFDHDTVRFALDVAHRRVSCAKCHKDQKVVNGSMVRIYRGTPTECLKCH